MMPDQYEYRLTWEMPKSAAWVAMVEGTHGREVWKDEWAKNRWDGPLFMDVVWEMVERITDTPFDQFRALLEWAASHEQPIRHVVLQRRERPVPTEGWEQWDPFWAKGLREQESNGAD